jgi:hypothetical protein
MDENVFSYGGSFNHLHLNDIRVNKIIQKIKTLEQWTGFIQNYYQNMIIYGDWKNLICYDIRKGELCKKTEFHTSGIWDATILNTDRLLTISSDQLINKYNFV